MKIGDFVCFAKDAPEKSEYCGVWSWDHGLVLQIEQGVFRENVSVMDINGEIHKVVIEYVQEIEEGHWHPGMSTDEDCEQSSSDDTSK